MNKKGHPWDFFRHLLSMYSAEFSPAPGTLYQQPGKSPVPSSKFDQSNAPSATLEIHPHVCTPRPHSPRLFPIAIKCMQDPGKAQDAPDV